jgi:hypothetical protein
MNNEGTIYFLYNPGTNRIEFNHGEALKFAIPLWCRLRCGARGRT